MAVGNREHSVAVIIAKTFLNDVQTISREIDSRKLKS